MEIVRVLYNGNGEIAQEYSQKDDSLITNNFINTSFGDTNDVIEYFITDENGIQLKYNYDSKDYYTEGEVNSGTNKFTQILLNPEKDIRENGFTRGKTTIQYNFFKNLFNSTFQNRYWIKEISNSRLELKLSSQIISGDDMSRGVQSYQIYSSQKNYYSDFYINFGNNDLVIAVNAAYVNDNGNSYLLIKLYEPLPTDFDIKSSLWIVDKLGDSVAYEVDIQVEAEQLADDNRLRGPNFKIKIADKIGQSTPYYSYNSLFSSPVSSSIQQLMSYYEDKAISINVDYSDFSNFIHFSSATERVNNFVYKLGLIENYNKQIYSQSVIIGNATIISSSIQTIKSNIDNIINKFDPYEYYLYYTSESFSWPKRTSTKPYSIYSVSSSAALNWLGSENTLPSITGPSILYSASYYDDTNKDILSKTAVPQYIIDDPNNEPYIAFLDMIGQHFDNIWIYYKDISNRYNATNNPNTGVSMDLVADCLRGLGIELYTNTNLSDNIFYSLFGYNQDGSLLPPTGSEKNINYVTSSLTTLPYDQTTKEIYKRIYHNLPYLLKTKGTARGVKALISCYGIPETILSPIEFGGYDRTTTVGLIDENVDKIAIIPTGSNELSQSLLSAYSTLQLFDNDNRKNSNNLEIGFSPSDTINTNISSSVGYFNIDNLIGNPALQYSGSYTTLDTYRENYFTSYTNKHSVWEYIRLLKFYNNSLFKMIKDFVPARSNISTGVIIKPHILERSKYARHEPSMSFQNYSESIDTAFITASAATSYTGNTTHYRLITSSLGYIPATESFGFEKYTGQYQGTKIYATSLNSVGDQTEASKNAITSSRVNFGATYQNITASVRSQKYLDLDYGYNALIPVNFGIITKSINDSQINNYQTYTNKNNPYAELQDFNYFAQRSTIQRYYGSKVESLRYNNYSTASSTWGGDKAYGNSPAIDLRTSKLALFTQIFTSSFFPGEVNATLAYLVDRKTGLYELNELNNNWFEVQNTFKAGRTLTIKQFDNKKYSNQKLTDGEKQLFESGYRYVPILYASQGTDTKIYYSYAQTPLVRLTATNLADDQGIALYNRYISGSTFEPRYGAIRSGNDYTASIFNVFDVEIEDQSNAYSAGDGNSQVSASYEVQRPGDYSVDILLNVEYEVSSSLESGSLGFYVYKNGVLVGSQNRIYDPNGSWPNCFTSQPNGPTTVSSNANYRVKLYRNPSNTLQIGADVEYIGTDRFYYQQKYLMPQGNYTASLNINFIKGNNDVQAVNWIMPISSSTTNYYTTSSWITNFNANYPNVANSIQTPVPTVTSPGPAGTVKFTFKFYGTGPTFTSLATTKNVAQLAKGYAILTTAGTNRLNTVTPFDVDNYATLTYTYTTPGIGTINNYWSPSVVPNSKTPGYIPPTSCAVSETP
jgi:hypothetical protein